jgi:uncharacterized protein YutE (UPF0331/DUF86 family)
MLQAARFLRGTDLVSKEDVRDFERLQQLRNKLVHGIIDDRDALTPEIINQVRQLREKFSEE